VYGYSLGIFILLVDIPESITYSAQARAEAITLPGTLAEVLNRTSKYTWTIEMVKSARCTEDPEFLFTYSKNLPQATQDAIRACLDKFYSIASSYSYEGINGHALNSVWEYSHPRTNCDHSDYGMDCPRTKVIVPVLPIREAKSGRQRGPSRQRQEGTLASRPLG
jgi:hypothetical protein